MSGYAKALGGLMQLFPKKINVTVIDEITGTSLGKYKIPLEQLPTAFDKPTIMEVEGHTWRVVKADPVTADDFSIFKKLTVHVLQKEHWQDERLLFNIPTRHAYHPLMTHEPLFNEFTLDVGEDDWRQLEFLPVSALPAIQEEMERIELKVPNALWGYKNMHVREQTADLSLNIPLAVFCDTVQAQKMGAVRLYSDAFVQHGIAIESGNYTYYGTVAEDCIVSLCLPSFDGIDDEFMQMVTTYKLVLVDWRGGRVVMIDMGGQVSETAAPDFNSDLSPI